jgi:hypothetical protein
MPLPEGYDPKVEVLRLTLDPVIVSHQRSAHGYQEGLTCLGSIKASSCLRMGGAH